MKENYNINQTTLKLIGQYSSNYKSAMHLRELARAVKVDPKAVGLQLKRLELTNILSSTMKGRNREYCLNLNNINTKYYILMAEMLKSISFIERKFLIKKLISEIASDIDGSILLFGSFAKEKETKESDIDIAIITEDTRLQKSKIYGAKITQVGNEINREINIKMTGKAGFAKGLREKDPLIAEIIGNHIILQGADVFCGLLWDYYVER